MALTEYDQTSVAVERRVPLTSTVSRVCLFGASLDVANRGVLALGVSLAGLVSRARPDVRVVFHYGNSTGGVRHLDGAEGGIDIEVRNCRLSPRSAPDEHIAYILALALLHRLGIRKPAESNRWLRSLLDADFIGEIRGGDSFSDIYGVGRFVSGCLPLLTVVLLRRPYAMLPQTYGPFKHRSSRHLARFFLSRAKRVMTRDRNCSPLVVELCGREPDFCPDVAFTLDALPPDSANSYLSGTIRADASDVVVGMNVSGLLYMGGYTKRNMFGLHSDYREMVDQLVDRFLESTRARILLVPHEFGTEGEEAACAAILRRAEARHPGRVVLVTRPLSEREAKWVIRQTDFFIGSRMHACIAALSQAIPTVGLAYSDKFLGVFQSAGVGDSIIDLRNVEARQVVDGTLTLFDARELGREQLRARIPAIRQQIEQTFGELLRY